ncbi:hypothetical protein MASR2M78_31210 [Treponema sp.]
MHIVIEAERGTNKKYILDKDLVRIGFRETLITYPYPYGFILKN